MDVMRINEGTTKQTRGERREKKHLVRRYGMKVTGRRAFLWEREIGKRANKAQRRER